MNLTIDRIVQLAGDAGLSKEGQAKLRRDLELIQEGQQSAAPLPHSWPATRPDMPSTPWRTPKDAQPLEIRFDLSPTCITLPPYSGPPIRDTRYAELFRS